MMPVSPASAVRAGAGEILGLEKSNVFKIRSVNGETAAYDNYPGELLGASSQAAKYQATFDKQVLRPLFNVSVRNVQHAVDGQILR